MLRTAKNNDELMEFVRDRKAEECFVPMTFSLKMERNDYARCFLNSPAGIFKIVEFDDERSLLRIRKFKLWELVRIEGWSAAVARWFRMIREQGKFKMLTDNDKHFGPITYAKNSWRP
ncbi:MAG TPA: hypothetical protein VJ521_04510 [Acidobacteriota bacterium]|nr:hypothetical protein [Acidobacteriota bacterium]